MGKTQIGTNTGVTLSEQKLLEVLLNPENRMKSITDICGIAKCDRKTYYRAFAKQEFIDAYNTKSKELVKQAVAPVINTFIREAQRGSFQHGKVLLEMAGMYAEKQEIKADVENTVNANLNLSGFTTEQLKDMLK